MDTIWEEKGRRGGECMISDQLIGNTSRKTHRGDQGDTFATQLQITATPVVHVQVNTQDGTFWK